MKSFNSIEQNLKEGNPCFDFMNWKRKPSADTLGYALGNLNNCDDFRDMVYALNYRVKRNKVFAVKSAGIVCAIDGHELFSSRSRCCAQCSCRNIQVKGQEVKEYYHRIVVSSIVTEGIILLLDLELQLPHEGELTVAKRLLSRILKRYPKYFHYITLDALYADKNIVELARKHQKEVVIVLKQNCKEILRDAQGLFKLNKPQIIIQGNFKQYLHDEENLSSWDAVADTLRVVESEEVKETVKYVGGKKILVNTKHHWVWVTTAAKSKTLAEVIAQIGHLRWKLENRGFNELVNYWNFDHCWKHNPKAIESMLFIIWIAYLMFDLFFQLNLKPEKRLSFNKIDLRKYFIQDFGLVLQLDSG